jgi:hypothetical protein
MATNSAKAASTKAIGLLVVAGLLVFTLPTVLILCAGMLPTAVAFLVDRRREKYTTLCVGSMNFVGVIPLLAKLWTEDHSYDMAFTILGDPFSWLMMLGSAGIGWTIYFVAPNIVAMFIATRIEQRIEKLKTRQTALEEEWGSDVSGNEEDNNKTRSSSP